MTTRTFSQTPPDKANELFEKLLATSDNAAKTRERLLSELDGMPKNNGEFLSKVTALRKVFQQHIRDDKKELLPAVLKVLSDEEAEEVAKKVEDEMATVEETKRAEARRAGEHVETVQR